MIRETITRARLSELTATTGTLAPIPRGTDDRGRPIFTMTGPALSLAAVVFTDTPINEIPWATDQSRWTYLDMVLETR
jgi:hypothetical protein